MNFNDVRLAVIGLGYVGLPLAIEFGKKYHTVGFDINARRIEELTNSYDRTLEVSSDEFLKSKMLSYTTHVSDIAKCNVYIVTVPTPIDKYNRPDLAPLLEASKIIGSVIKRGDTVIYESTVYPGATEDDCVPVIESVSGLKFNTDFFAGYSPERIKPGDKEHKFTTIKKVTSGSDSKTADFVDKLYQSVVTAGTHKAPSIKIAEAAKVIENTQRDLNIALINELSIIFNIMGIDTEAVLDAAGSKWNFLPFRPGLVGGHCIGVDPYYLTHKAQSLGYHPELILAGRRINDLMAKHVASQVVKIMMKKRIHVVESNILVMGLAFKENCPDLRNTKVINIVNELQALHVHVDIYDPLVDVEEAWQEYKVRVIEAIDKIGLYDAVIIAVGHDQIKKIGIDKIKALCKPIHVIYDVKYAFDFDEVDGRL